MASEIDLEDEKVRSAPNVGSSPVRISGFNRLWTLLIMVSKDS